MISTTEMSLGVVRREGVRVRRELETSLVGSVIVVVGGGGDVWRMRGRFGLAWIACVRPWMSG